jgi:hypothetical protein
MCLASLVSHDSKSYSKLIKLGSFSVPEFDALKEKKKEGKKG